MQPSLWWKSNKYYLLWVCVCSLGYPACNAHVPYCHLWRGISTKLSTLSHKRNDFRGKFTEHKTCVLIFSTTFVWNISHSRKNWAGHVARMGEERGVYSVLVGKPEGKRPMGRPRRRWVDNITTYLQEVGCGYMDWIGLAQDRDRWRTLVSAVMNLGVPWNAGNFLTSYKPVSFSRRTVYNGGSK